MMINTILIRLLFLFDTEAYENEINTWLPSLDLNINDHNEIMYNKKLTSRHMEAVNRILKK